MNNAEGNLCRPSFVVGPGDKGLLAIAPRPILTNNPHCQNLDGQLGQLNAYVTQFWFFVISLGGR